MVNLVFIHKLENHLNISCINKFLSQVASSCGSADMLLLLLNYGPDLNAQDIHQRTPTMLAAKGHISVLGI